ncbi:MAG: DUF2066 domain-containing protein [gamma proteobacterium symbiont of Bathyaustriella thionipta]|nr:DUF2066 domain-containing protein [gamma proteobacterium symbiont of Bathyaustriella thionipta]
MFAYTHVYAAGDLYSASAPLQQDDKAGQDAAIQQAFSRVLLKVSGDRHAAADKALKHAAADLVQQYQRRLDDAEPPQSSLWVQFNEAGVNDLLRANGYTVWGQPRPEALLWVGLQQADDRRLISADESKELLAEVRQVARERGLPLIFPLMDLQDRAALKASHLWGDFEQSIREASDRYDTALVLTVRIHEQDRKRWQASWAAYSAHDSSHFESEAVSAGKALALGLNQFIDTLVRQSAVPVGRADTQQLRVRISNINNFSDYENVRQYLQQTGLVGQISPLRLAADEVEYSLRLNAPESTFKQRLSLDNVLEAAPTVVINPGAANAGAVSILEFRYLQ